MYFLTLIYKVLFNLINKVTNKKINKEILSYLIIGGSGFVIQLCLTKTLIILLKSNYLALFISIFIAANWNFYFYNSLTFEKKTLKGRDFYNGLIKFYLSSSFALLLNFFITLIFFKYIYENLFISQFFGIFFVFILNFLIAKKIIWKK